MPNEDPQRRVNRELIELLNELRIALPGVQVLFAFLLIVPFQQMFGQTSQIARYVYFAGLIALTLSIVMLIAPATYHRLNLRRSVEEKEEMLLTSNKLALAGIACLGIGIACAMFVVADVMFGTAAAAAVALAATLLIISLWFVLPVWQHRSRTAEHSPSDDSGR